MEETMDSNPKGNIRNKICKEIFEIDIKKLIFES